MKKQLAALLGMAALVQGQAAQAQAVCVAPADLDDAVVYSMPLAYDAAQAACADEFAADGFMRQGGAAFADGFRARQDAAWPGAFRMLKVFMAKGDEGSGSEEVLSLLSSMPDGSLRPFVDAIITQKLVEEIKPDTCGKIERAVELISPLPVENVSGLVTFIVEQSGMKNPEVCKPSTETVAN